MWNSVLVDGHSCLSQSRPKDHTRQVSCWVSRLVSVVVPEQWHTLGIEPRHYLGKSAADRLLLGSLVRAMAIPFIQVRCLCDHPSDQFYSTARPTGHHGWLHWTNGLISQGGRPNLDFWPDISEYSPSELFAVPGLHMADGGPASVFSSRHPDTVRRHFHWMALNGVDGAFLQRFVGQCDVEKGNHGIRHVRDEVGQRVREAAEAEGRVFAIMFVIYAFSSSCLTNLPLIIHPGTM